jgi:hypothetical protein
MFGVVMKRTLIYCERKQFKLSKDNSNKIIELSNMLKISQNKVVNLMIEMLNPTHLIIYKKNKEVKDERNIIKNIKNNCKSS